MTIKIKANKDKAALLGNAVNIIILVVAIGYQVLTFGHFSEWWTLERFGTNWAQDGFCLSFKDTLYHTHLLCLYGDMVLAAGLYWLSKNETRPELAIVKSSCLSIVGHGLAHGGLWFNGDMNMSDMSIRKADDSLYTTLLSVLGMTIFFSLFLKIVAIGPVWLQVFQSLIHGVVMILFVPPILNFSYVNSVIFVNLTFTQLWDGLEGEKDEFFLLFSVLASGVTMAAAIAEPLLCDSLLVNLGGHILFDFSIPLSTVAYFLIAKSMKPREVKVKVL